MAYSDYSERRGSMGSRTQEYGYGLDDIQHPNQGLIDKALTVVSFITITMMQCFFL